MCVCAEEFQQKYKKFNNSARSLKLDCVGLVSRMGDNLMAFLMSELKQCIFILESNIYTFFMFTFFIVTAHFLL